MNRPLRRSLIAIGALAALVAGGFVYVDVRARVSLEDAVDVYARFKSEDRAGPRGRPALVDRIGSDDALALYARPGWDARVQTNEDAVAAFEALAAAGQRPLTLPAGAEFPIRGPAALAGRLQSHLRDATSPETSLRRCGALLVMASDAMEFGPVDDWASLASSGDGALNQIRETIELRFPGPASLAATARLLEALEARAPSARGLKRACAIAAAIASGTETVTWPSGGGFEIHRNVSAERIADARWLWCERWVRADTVRRIGDDAARLVAAWRGPPTNLRAEATALRSRFLTDEGVFLQGTWYGLGSGPGPVSGIGLWSPEIWLDALCFWRARMSVARAAIAVARFRADRGALPASLVEIVPQFLPSAPIDPMTGEPLGYDRGRVWAVGPDGKDDHGRPAGLNGGLGLGLVEADWLAFDGIREFLDGDVVWTVADHDDLTRTGAPR